MNLPVTILLAVALAGPAAGQPLSRATDWTKPVIGVDGVSAPGDSVELVSVQVELLERAATADAPLPPPCEQPTARAPGQPPGPPSPAPAPCRP